MAAPPVEPVVSDAEPETISIAKQREQLLWSQLKQSATPNGAPRPQAVNWAIQLATLYLEQDRLDQASTLITWLNEQQKSKELQLLGRVIQAMNLALRNQAAESTAIFESVFGGRDVATNRLTMALNRNAGFLRWMVKALDYNAANLAASNKSLPPELEALRKARPIPARPASAAPNRPAGKAP
jgi:hypothetical protein